MTKKTFLSIAMVFLGLLAGINTAWATDPNPETDYYWAKLTARPSTGTVGSGKVLVLKDKVDNPPDEDYQETRTASKYINSYIQAVGNDEVTFSVYAKPNAGSYFAGWSDYNGGTEKADDGIAEKDFSYKISPKKGLNNAKEYTIYATFEPIRFVSYTIKKTAASFEVTIATDYNEIELADFEEPSVNPKDGTGGTWTAPTTGKRKWSASGKVLTVQVNLTGASTPAEYAATLTVTTKAGISMKIPLYHNSVTPEENYAVLYDGKTLKKEGTVEKMLAEDISTYTNPILKLSGDYAAPVEVNKDLTFDLNGYTLNSTITVSGGNVTLAYSPYGGSANALNITGGKAILNGGSFGSLEIADGATVEQNGATITGAVTNDGVLTTTDGKFQGGLTSSKTLVVNGGTFTNNSGEAITITNGTATIKRGSITGKTYGVQTTGGTTTIEKLAVVRGGTKALNGAGGSLIVNNGKFTDPSELIAGTVTFNAGYFQTATGPIALDKQVWRNTAGAEFREGYEFFVGSQESAQESNVSVCRIGQASYASLEDALAYANNNPGKQMLIFMENDYVLKAGYYTLPANATLVVPMEEGQKTSYPVVKNENEAPVEPAIFRTLVIASGVNLNVLGTIELSGKQYSHAGSPEQAIPGGTYGRLILQPGSHITLGDGAELRAWGYVTGDGTRAEDGTYLSGEIDARRGSTVREQFQIGDWKGGDVSFTMIMNSDPQQKTHLFPIYEYFIQNIESPVKYHPGSSLFCATSVNVSGGITAYANDIKVVGLNGDAAMFLMDPMADAENTWVRKWYDANKDKQVYEVNSGAQLGSMVIDLGEVPKVLIDPGQPGMYKITMDSRKYILPLTSNMKIHLLSGNMQFTQSTSCLPGMEVEIDKESTITIINQEQADVVEGALYLYDADQWGKYVMNGEYGSIVHYSATLGARPNVRDVSSAEALGDAILNVHGTFQVGENCAVYTTVGKTESPSGTFTQNISSGGASIISNNEDAGTFIFLSEAPVASEVSIQDGMFVFNEQGELNPEVLVNYDNSTNGLVISPTARGDSAHIYGFELCTSARLQNGDGTFAETAGVAQGKSYCYMNDHWTLMEVDTDDECFMKDNYGTYYAKPAEYVAVNATWDGTKMVGNTDHTFSDKEGTGRLFILIKQDCQWWEVKKKDNLYHCIHPDNDTYYYWDDSNSNPEKHKWVEKRFVITWKNWNGESIQTTDENGEPVEAYSVTYGTMAEFLGSNPTREPNIDYTYDFTGWTPELGPVKSDVTYTATYNEQPRKYTVIFLNEGGTEIERQFLTHNEMPSCENIPTRTGFTLEWSPAIAAVTGDATYTAKWLEEPPTKYEITFFDYNGTTILQQGDVNVGETPIKPDAPANKPATKEFTYVFDHWSPAIEEVSATSAKSYVAVYSEVAKTYTISYYKEDGSTLISTESLPYGATPTPPVVSKENPAANTTYTLVWKTLNETSGIQTVMGQASYKPTYIAEENRYTRYTVTLSANISAGVTLIGAGTYDEGESVTIQAIPAEGYEFVQWNDGETNPERDIVSITEDHTLSAEVRATAVAEDLKITATGSVTLDAPATKHDLVITSNGVTSGELIGANYLTLTGDAYFDLKMAMDARTWYAVAVPWKVDAASGIIVNDTPLRLGIDMDVIRYDGAQRAAAGKVKDWIYLEYEADKTMYPGTLYMIYLANDASVIRFKKKEGADILTTTLSVKAYPSEEGTGDITDAGWNGIANPALYHAYINANAETYAKANFAQKYNPASEAYDAIDLTQPENQLIVGAPIFVQVAADKNDFSVYDNWSDAAAHAPRRAPRVDNAYYEVHISAGEAYTDRLYLQTLEDKEDRYVIGLDLAKAGVSNKVAQMWVSRYNAKLCVNTTAPVGKTATYPLGISVPENGTYQISSATEMQANQELYVTRNGSAIWNLAYGPYTVTLDKGTYSEYGIKLIQSNAPAVTTGVDQTTTDKQQIQKVVIDNHVYIVRDGALYTITGQKVQ